MAIIQAEWNDAKWKSDPSQRTKNQWKWYVIKYKIILSAFQNLL